MHGGRWIYGQNCQVKILAEFSLSELMGVVWLNDRQNASQPKMPATQEQIHELKYLQLDRACWQILYTRREANEFGTYIATALRRGSDEPEEKFASLPEIRESVRKIYKEVFGPKP
jgi:hypothetical protein